MPRNCPKPAVRSFHAIARALALVAMVVQVLFLADHLGAVAAKALGTADADARLGFMEICTGNGIEVVSLGDAGNDSGHDCPICENASVMAFGEPAAMPAPAFPVVAFVAVWGLPAEAHAADARFPGVRPIRGPPAGA